MVERRGIFSSYKTLQPLLHNLKRKKVAVLDLFLSISNVTTVSLQLKIYTEKREDTQPKRGQFFNQW